jgi:hypothetical protein
MGLSRKREGAIKFGIAQAKHFQFLSRFNYSLGSHPSIEGGELEVKRQGYAVHPHLLQNSPLPVRGWRIGEQVFQFKVQCRDDVARGTSGKIMQEDSPIRTLGDTQAWRIVFVCGASGRPLPAATRADVFKTAE